MWTQVWPIADLQQLQDREVRKVIVDVQSRGKHHLGSTELSCTFPENSEEEALKSVEEEYKLTKIKVVVKLYSSPDPVMPVVRRYEENAEENGRRALIKGAKKKARKLVLELN